MFVIFWMFWGFFWFQFFIAICWSFFWIFEIQEFFFWISLDFLGIFLFLFFAMFLRIILRVTEVTTKHQNWPKISENS